MDFEALLVVGGFVIAIGAVLVGVAFLVARFMRSPLPNHIRVTGLGICFGVLQALATFAIVGFGFFRPETFLGRVVAHAGGVPAIIIAVSFICYPICVAAQHRGIVLFYRVQGSG